MKEFEVATFNKETATSDTKKNRARQRKISLLLPQFVNCVKVIQCSRQMFENFVMGQTLWLTGEVHILLRAPC
jgi:hypothetical protein